jgi:hypothetical protein
VICSITSIGLAMPPDQKAFQIWSILLLSSPVSMGGVRWKQDPGSLLERLAGPGLPVRPVRPRWMWAQEPLFLGLV